MLDQVRDIGVASSNGEQLSQPPNLRRRNITAPARTPALRHPADSSEMDGPSALAERLRAAMVEPDRRRSGSTNEHRSG